jgi:hypothetical protein
MTTEVWLPVVGYEGYYEISSLGNLRSVDRVVRYKANGTMLRKGRPMRLTTTKYGYIDVRLGKEGVEKAHLVHRLVAAAFLDNPESKPQVNHKNGVKGDNRLENLEWASKSENRLHSYKVLNARNWLREVGSNKFYINDGSRNKWAIGHTVVPKGWQVGVVRKNQLRSAA